jgi:UDP-GlcNAc:undecaprenyl-phosphate/decaprenyl-phosphate GlcNAc-1-phosphate transferase
MILGQVGGGEYLLGFGLAFALTAAATPIVRKFALAHGIVDKPGERKIHKAEIAYLGGLAIFLGFVVAVVAMLPITRELAALLMGCAILVIIGVIDDIRGLSPTVKLVFQFVAAAVALSGGIGLTALRNPFGGVIDLTVGRFPVDLLGLKFHIAPIANLLSILWMVGLANVINFLDGLDGLASGVSGMAGIVMFILAFRLGQPAVALLALILAGSAFGFLPYNFSPAKIFMGDSGAYFLGLCLAMLAIYSGGKVATAALVLGFPIMDAVWAAIRRIARGESPFKADRGHLHHLLLDAGMSQRQAVMTLYAVSALFGTVALLSDSLAKLVALVALMILMALAIATLTLAQRRKTGAKSAN